MWDFAGAPGGAWGTSVWWGMGAHSPQRVLRTRAVGPQVWFCLSLLTAGEGGKFSGAAGVGLGVWGTHLAPQSPVVLGVGVKRPLGGAPCTWGQGIGSGRPGGFLLRAPS